jgi:hypothetical protein
VGELASHRTPVAAVKRACRRKVWQPARRLTRKAVNLAARSLKIFAAAGVCCSAHLQQDGFVCCEITSALLYSTYPRNDATMTSTCAEKAIVVVPLRLDVSCVCAFPCVTWCVLLLARELLEDTCY